MAKYHLSNKALQDLDSIWLYTVDNWSERLADDYYESLVSAFHSISMAPCGLDKEYSSIHVGLYCRICRKHLVFYRVIENGDVEIVRILHERMDVSSKF